MGKLSKRPYIKARMQSIAGLMQVWHGGVEYQNPEFFEDEIVIL